MTGNSYFFIVAWLVCSLARSADPHSAQDVLPLFDTTTKLKPAMTEVRDDAIITRIGDRVRDRHAREAEFKAYDHYLSFYWQERTFSIEIVDRVAQGGNDITIHITSLTPLNNPNFRCFFRGINTVAEYHHNAIAKEVAPNQYSTTIQHNPQKRRELQRGDSMEFEFSSFLAKPQNGRTAYYGTALLYVIGRGIVPWQGAGEKLHSVPLPEEAWLGGRTTLPYQYSNEPQERFKQMAGNIAPQNVQTFMLGRRLHHTDFGNGSHSDQPNPPHPSHAEKLGPGFVQRSCVACHVNNGRALPPAVATPMYQTVIKVGHDAFGAPHAQLGSALQPQSTHGPAEATAMIRGFQTVTGNFADGTVYVLKNPRYTFQNIVPQYFSVRLTPPLVGLGLLEAISEREILAHTDPTDVDGDGISGRAQIVRDPETGDLRLGRFGYKAGQARLRHQIAGALNNDMGVTTLVFPNLDGAADLTSPQPEIKAADLGNLTHYISLLGVSARRDLDDPQVVRGEVLFTEAGCAQCHLPELVTGPHHPLAELRNQIIHPYTDLLLHDMGEGLADNFGEHTASGAEWRTTPLWSLGLTPGVSGGEAYLHDGRATSLTEAILWHAGEAAAAQQAFKQFPQADRLALVRFLKSL